MLQTERLILRKWRFDDACYMYQYCSDNEVGHRCGFLPHKSIEVSKEIISNFINFCPYCYAICKTEDINIPIGCIELMKRNEPNTLELGFWLGKPYWGYGYMKEAAIAVMDYGFNELGVDKIICSHYEDNYNSKRVQEKLGFLFDHKVDDHYVSQLDKTVVQIVNVMTKERWNNIK